MRISVLPSVSEANRHHTASVAVGLFSMKRRLTRGVSAIQQRDLGRTLCRMWPVSEHFSVSTMSK